MGAVILVVCLSLILIFLSALIGMAFYFAGKGKSYGQAQVTSTPATTGTATVDSWGRTLKTIKWLQLAFFCFLLFCLCMVGSCLRSVALYIGGSADRARKEVGLRDGEENGDQKDSSETQKAPASILLYDEVDQWLRSCYNPNEDWQVLPQKHVAWTTDCLKGYHLPQISTALLPTSIQCNIEVVGGMDSEGLSNRVGKFLQILSAQGQEVYYDGYNPSSTVRAGIVRETFWLLVSSHVDDGHVGLSYDMDVKIDVPEEVRKTRLLLEKRFELSDLERLVHVCTLPTKIMERPVLYDLHVAFYPAMKPGTRVMDAMSLDEEHLLPVFAPKISVLKKTKEECVEKYVDEVPSNGYRTISMEGFRRLAGDFLRKKDVKDNPDTKENEAEWDGSGELFVYVPKYAPEGEPVLITCRVAMVIRTERKL